MTGQMVLTIMLRRQEQLFFQLSAGLQLLSSFDPFDIQDHLPSLRVVCLSQPLSSIYPPLP